MKAREFRTRLSGPMLVAIGWLLGVTIVLAPTVLGWVITTAL